MTEEKVTAESSGEILREGRRHLFCRDYTKAVEKLSQACQLMAVEHGEDNVILADAFYSYGEALLEMARMETPVLGNALQGTSEVMDVADEKEMEVADEEPNESLNDEQKNEIADKVIDALCEAPVVDKGEKPVADDKTDESDTKAEESKISEVKCAGDIKEQVEKTESEKVEHEKAENAETCPESKKDDAEKKDDTEDKDDAEKDDTEDKDDGEEKDNEKDEDDENEDDDESNENEEEAAEDENDGEDVTAENENDVGNLQLAWEIIEVARTLFEKKAALASEESQKSHLRVADCHKKLAEVMMERDEWEPAVEELRKCLDIEKKYLTLPSRRIAETYFEMGIVLDNAEKPAEATDAFQQSVSSLEEYQKSLSEKDDKTEADEKEIKELDGVLEEVKAKIADTNQKASEVEAGGASSSGITTNGFGSSSNGVNGTNGTNGVHSDENGKSTKETTDISHLIRKRPKDADKEGESPLKKTRVDPDGDKADAATAEVQ